MDTMTQPRRTACHGCRPMVMRDSWTSDGVYRPHRTPAMGDGDVVELVFNEDGWGVPQVRSCEVCGGSGWLPGFQPPC